LGFGDGFVLGEPIIIWLLFIDDELFIECIAAGLAEGEADAMAAARSMFNMHQLRLAAAAG